MSPGFRTLLFKEVLRFWKVAFQTIAAPVLTAVLYLLIFGHALNIGIQRHAPLFGALLALLGDAHQRRDLDAVIPPAAPTPTPAPTPGITSNLGFFPAWI